VLILISDLVFIEERIDGMRWGNGCISEVVLTIEFLEVKDYRDKAGYGFDAL